MEKSRDAKPDFRALFEAAPGLYLVLTPDLRIVAVSDAYLRGTMTRREEILGRGLFDVFPDNPDDPGATGERNLRASLQRVMQDRRADAMAVQKYDIRRPEQEGGGFEERYWSPVNTPVFGEDREIAYIIHRAEDVTEFVRLKQSGVERDKLTVELRERVERMEAENFRRSQELEESNRRQKLLEAFIEHAPVGLAMFDRDMRYVRASRRWIEECGILEKEILGKTHYEIFPDMPGHWKEAHRRGLAGESLQGEDDWVALDGKKHSIRWEIQPWGNFGVNTGGIIIFSEDITDRKVAAESLRDSEARLRLAQQVARVGTFEWNIPAGVNRWTPELEAIYGLPPGGFAGTQQAWEALIYAKDRPEAVRRVQAALETGRFEGEWRVQWPDGTLHWLFGRAWLFRDDSGRPLRLIGVNIDITGRKRAEEVARQWQRAFEQAELAIGLSDVDSGTLRTVNDSFARERGYTVRELAGRPIGAIFPAVAQAVLRDSVAAADREGHVAFESEHQRKDGSCFPVRVDLTVVRNEAGEAASRVAFVQDLTAQKQAELQIRRLNTELEKRVRERTAQLEAANKELEAFSFSVSHDLRAPLGGIDGWSLALEEDYASNLDERARQYLGRVRSEAQRMGLLIDALLELSRVSRAEMVCHTVDLTFVAHAIAARLREAHPDRRIEFMVDPGLTAAGDAGLLEIALTNLLSNAVKFTGPCAHARIEFGRTECAGERPFYIRDNGVGFDGAFASKLFGAFQRLHKSSEFPGTGIGLATVQRIVHRHGGRVWAEAQPGQGATFYFTIGDL